MCWETQMRVKLDLLDLHNAGYRISDVRVVTRDAREVVVVGFEPVTGKAVTWRGFNHTPDISVSGWVFETGHYFDVPGDAAGNYGKAVADHYARLSHERGNKKCRTRRFSRRGQLTATWKGKPISSTSR